MMGKNTEDRTQSNSDTWSEMTRDMGQGSSVSINRSGLGPIDKSYGSIVAKILGAVTTRDIRGR